jgi:8-oxo-dGTP pyrophosphatase MutT (NUDIX family)
LSEPVRPAAAVILTRRGATGEPEVLMGQRGAGAVFMPSKFVFPGGGVDPGDAGLPFARALPPLSAARVGERAATFAGAAIRELWEEAGLALAAPGRWECAGEGWRAFAGAGLVPDAGGLRFVFRAVTPPGRTRRFDAHFFLADAGSVAGDAGDLTRAGGELAHLAWLPLHRAKALDLPFITEIVLAEVGALLESGGEPERVAFFDNLGPEPAFRWID